MSGESALESQDSFEQSNFVAVARYLGARLCPRPEVWSGEGMYETYIENTALVTGCKNGEATYLGELLGRYAHQKWILIFHPSEKSPQRLFVIEFASPQPANTIQEMRRRGLNEGTILWQNYVLQNNVSQNNVLQNSVSQNNATAVRVYIWVKDNAKDNAVHAFADANHGRLQEVHGMGLLIGNDSRRLAQRTFDQGIAAYERKHKRAFSALLWSRKLHDLGDSQPITPPKTP